MKPFLVLLAILCFVGSLAARAQQPIPPRFDMRNPLIRIDARLAHRLNVFREFDGFCEARLFQSFATEYLLEVRHRIAESDTTVHISLSRAEGRRLLKLLKRGSKHRKPSEKSGAGLRITRWQRWKP
ncbi:MAG: hypothetical protein AAGB22_02685 [Bacteroidota bacterium]